MEDQRSAFDTANRPGPLLLGVAGAVIFIIVIASSMFSSTPASTPTAQVSAAPVPVKELGSLDSLRERLAKLNPSVPNSKIVWSSVLHDEVGAYRAMWFGHSSTLRADIDGSDHVTRFSLHTVRSSDRNDDRAIAAMMVNVSAPDASEAARTEAASALGGLMSRDIVVIPPRSTTTVGRVVMTLDTGALDYDLSASPAA